MLIQLKNKDKLIVGDFEFKCCIGKNRVKKHKIEAILGNHDVWTLKKNRPLLP